jgi:transposase InsO family protein
MALLAEQLSELRTALAAAPRGRRRELLEKASAFLGLSPATIYRKLRDMGGGNRKRRKDAGMSCVNRELAITVAALVAKGTRANGRRAMRMNTALEILEKNGLGPVTDRETGEACMPHPVTVARAMRRHGCHPDQLAIAGPHTGLRSLHPNHVWQMDASVCVIFYLPKGGMAALDERSYNEHKPALLAKLNRERVIRWLVVDHFSGAFFARYTLGGENAQTAIEILAEAMCRRCDTDPFCGVPRLLYTDPGPAHTAVLTRTWLARLNIRQETHMPGAARATGSVEVHQRIVEQGFEGRLRVYAAQNLADLNTRLDAWRIMYNARRIHSRHQKTRFAMWQAIKEEELRIPQDKNALLALAAGQETRLKVRRDLTIAYTPKGFARANYSLRQIPDIACGAEVGVSVNPFSAPALDITVSGRGGENRAYTVQPIAADGAGFALSAPVIGENVSRAPDTAADTALKDMARRAYSAPTLAQAKEAEKKKQAPFADLNIFADVEAAKPRVWMPKHGRDLTLSGAAREEILDHVGAAMELRERFVAAGREWTAAHMRRLCALYPEGAPAAAIPGLARQLLEEEAADRRVGMRLADRGAA